MKLIPIIEMEWGIEEVKSEDIQAYGVSMRLKVPQTGKDCTPLGESGPNPHDCNR